MSIKDKLDYILNNYEVSIGRKDQYLFLDIKYPKILDLKFLTGIHFPIMSSLYYVSPNSDNSISGLSQLQMPKLKSLHIDLKEISTEELSNIRFPSLKKLVLTGCLLGDLNLNLSKLTYLKIVNTVSIDLGFLNRCYLPKLKKIVVLSSPKNEILGFYNVDWGRFPNIREMCFSIPHGSNLILSNRLPTSLEVLKCVNAGIVLEDRLTLPNLEMLCLDISAIQKLDKLNLPNIHTVEIYNSLSQSLSLESITRMVRYKLCKPHIIVGYYENYREIQSKKESNHA